MSDLSVLHVVPNIAARAGGPIVGLVQAVAALERIGVTCSIVTTDLDATASSSSRHPVEESSLPAGASDVDLRIYRARPPRRFAYSPALRRALVAAAPEYDVVHVHGLYLYPQLAAFQAARHARVPFLLSPRGTLDPWLRARSTGRKALMNALWQNRMLNAAAALHVTSEGERALTADIAPHVPRYVVPNGIDWRASQQPADGKAFRDELCGGHSGPIVLFLGRLTEKKGVDILIRAFARSPATRDALLVLAGPDDDGLGEELQRLAVDEGVRERTLFVGMLDAPTMRSALAATDVWALPSHAENFGNAVIEALAAGVACVVSSGVNIAPEVEQAGAALIRPPAVEPFAEALTTLLEDVELREALGAAGRELARTFSWDEVAPRLRAMYEAVVATATVGPSAGGSAATS
jgi:glycosyltransferase involved in cell wall biosynthesis